MAAGRYAQQKGKLLLIGMLNPGSTYTPTSGVVGFSGAFAAGGAGAEVQSGSRCRTWSRAARLGSGHAQGQRCWFRAHAAAGRAGQGPERSARHAVAAAVRTAARLVAS